MDFFVDYVRLTRVRVITRLCEWMGWMDPEMKRWEANVDTDAL